MRKAAALSLLGSSPVPVFVDRGRMMNKAEVSREVCDSKATPKWLIEHMAPDIGMKHGREYLFYESEARNWWAKYLDSKRRTA